MFCKAWKYTVSSDHTTFEEVYGRNGVWFKFFEPCDDFLGQELMKGADGNSYIVLDKWISEADYQDFLTSNQTEYEAIQTQTRELYDEELPLGNYIILQ